MTTEVEALQSTLEAEHAAVYVYGLLGARTSESGDPALYAALRAAYETHRQRRDDLIGEIAALGAAPVGPAAAYDAPDGLDSADAVTRAALVLERGCASTYAALVGSTRDDRRRAAIGLLHDAAARELVFRGTPEMFPGADEYADR